MYVIERGLVHASAVVAVPTDHTRHAGQRERRVERRVRASVGRHGKRLHKGARMLAPHRQEKSDGVSRGWQRSLGEQTATVCEAAIISFVMTSLCTMLDIGALEGRVDVRVVALGRAQGWARPPSWGVTAVRSSCI